MSPSEIRTTPRSYEPSRGLYEDAVRRNDSYLIASIELDTVLEGMQQLYGSQRISTEEACELIDEYTTELVDSIDRSYAAQQNSITDIYRLINGATFATERFLAPFAFASNTNESDDLRSFISNGTVGHSTDIISTLLDSKYESRWRNTPESYTNNIIGAINESTVIALLNTEQSSSMLAVPANTTDDIKKRTDVNYYLYDHEYATGHRLDINVKSGVDQKLREKRAHPRDIVVCAADFSNSNFAISKLLIRKYEGSPGLSDQEEARLHEAYISLVRAINCQLPRARARQLVLPKDFDSHKLHAPAA